MSLGKWTLLLLVHSSAPRRSLSFYVTNVHRLETAWKKRVLRPGWHRCCLRSSVMSELGLGGVSNTPILLALLYISTIVVIHAVILLNPLQKDCI